VPFPFGIKKMKIQLRLFASLSKFLPEEKGTDFSNLLKVEEGTTIKDLLDTLKIPQDLPEIIFLNGVRAEKNTILKEGDRLGIFPPLAGG
jgi:sulfur-carrier protein